jgi:hypothetical protein
MSHSGYKRGLKKTLLRTLTHPQPHSYPFNNLANRLGRIIAHPEVIRFYLSQTAPLYGRKKWCFRKRASLRTAGKPKLLKTWADSTGRRNTGLEFTRWSFKAQGFPRALVKLQGYLVEIGLGVVGQVGFPREGNEQTGSSCHRVESGSSQ